MRQLALIVLMLLVGPLSLAGQDSTTASETKKRVATLMAGGGNVFGWFGLHGEYYFARDRLSAFLGAGYTPADDGDLDPTGPTFAIGLRGFTPGVRHRGFLALSLSQIATLSAFEPERRDRFYGPGLEAGYHYTARGGFTFMVSLGLGIALGVPDGEDEVHGMGGLGLGYTWRR
jgi:hypothetical protein